MTRLALLWLLAAGCATTSTASPEQLIHTASELLSCPADSLEVAVVSESTHFVRGCKHAATFVVNCDGECRWRMQGKPISYQP